MTGPLSRAVTYIDRLATNPSFTCAFVAGALSGAGHKYFRGSILERPRDFNRYDCAFLRTLIQNAQMSVLRQLLAQRAARIFGFGSIGRLVATDHHLALAMIIHGFHDRQRHQRRTGVIQMDSPGLGSECARHFMSSWSMVVGKMIVLYNYVQ